MPVTSGGGSSAPKKKTPKPAPAPKLGARGGHGGGTSEKEFHAGTVSGSSGNQVKGHRGVGDTGGTGSITKDQPVSVGGPKATGGGNKPKPTRQTNAKTFGFDAKQAPAQTTQKRRRLGGTATDGGGAGGGGGGRGTGPSNKGMPGVNTGGGVVGSRNRIDNFDGSYEDYGDGNDFSGGDVSGGGGGSGSALAGREAVGRVGNIDGQSLEEVVYGVQKRGRKVARPRGE